MDDRREAFAALKADLTAALAAPRAALKDALTTAVPELDRLLGGGFPPGALVAIEGNAGGWSIAARLAARVTARALVAVVDDGGLYPPSLAQSGVRLERVLVVPARTPLGIARAADILLRSRACRLVVMAAPALRAAVWARLASLAQRTGVVLVAIASGLAAPALAAAAALRLCCTRERLVVAGLRGLWCTFAGYVVRAELRKSKTFVATERTVRVRAVTHLEGASLRERPIAAVNQESAHAAVR